MTSQGPLRMYQTPELKSPSLIVGWREDAGDLGAKVIDYLVSKLEVEEVGEIESPGFFPFGEVRVEDNVIQSPDSRFYACQKNDLLIFKSSAPSYEHYNFLSSVLDFAQHYCRATELYTIGGIMSLMAHTAPRRIFTVVNQPELKEMLAKYGLNTDMEYQTPEGGRPTISSFLLWLAKRRDMVGVNLWAEVPFYLAAVDDLRAASDTLRFLDRRLGLSIDFAELDGAIMTQNERIARLREESPEINKLIGMLERGIMLSQDENEKLTREVMDFLGKGD